MLVSRCGLFNLLWRHEQQLSHFRRLRCSTAAREWVGGLNSASKVSTLCDPAPNHRLGKLFPGLARNRIEVRAHSVKALSKFLLFHRVYQKEKVDRIAVNQSALSVAGVREPPLPRDAQRAAFFRAATLRLRLYLLRPLGVVRQGGFALASA